VPGRRWTDCLDDRRELTLSNIIRGQARSVRYEIARLKHSHNRTLQIQCIYPLIGDYSFTLRTKLLVPSNRVGIVRTAERLSVSRLYSVVQGDNSGYCPGNGDKGRDSDQKQASCDSNPPFQTSIGSRPGATRFPNPHGCRDRAECKLVMTFTTHTAKGVPNRALIRVRRSSKTGIASEKMKTRTPVVTTEPLMISHCHA
jgi:hypothetical protein